MKVVGIIQKKGTYEGFDYNNLLLHCTYEDTNGNAAGVLTCHHKIKVKDIERIFGKKMSDNDLNNLVGCDIQVFYDQWRNVERIIIL